MECNKLCKKNDNNCKYCQEKYIVSNLFYKAKRPAANSFVKGYLIQNKEGRIEGILNSANNFAELAFIEDNTLKVIKDEIVPIYDHCLKVGEYDPSKILEEIYYM